MSFCSGLVKDKEKGVRHDPRNSLCSENGSLHCPSGCQEGVTGGMGKGAQKVSRIESFVERVSKSNYTTSAAVRAAEQTMKAD